MPSITSFTKSPSPYCRSFWRSNVVICHTISVCEKHCLYISKENPRESSCKFHLAMNEQLKVPCNHVHCISHFEKITSCLFHEDQPRFYFRFIWARAQTWPPLTLGTMPHHSCPNTAFPRQCWCKSTNNKTSMVREAIKDYAWQLCSQPDISYGLSLCDSFLLTRRLGAGKLLKHFGVRVLRYGHI